MARYSLANYLVSIKPSVELSNANQIFGTITIGGEGSYLDSITVARESSLYNTNGFSTGAWVHDKNLDKTGTVSISLSQLSDQVQKFIRLCETFYDKDYDGFTITITTNDFEKREICTCIDCYIKNIPSQEFQSTAQNQTWVFTCGKINFE